MKRPALLIVSFWLLAQSTLCFAVQRVEERDRDGDGRKESKVYFEDEKIVKIVMDQNADGAPDFTVFFKNNLPDTGEKDADTNGKIDTWIQYDSAGLPVVIGSDRHVDGKPDYWLFLKKGAIYKREWDRNFDGEADFRTLERDHKLLEKHYDDNFDGRFEKIIKAPVKGSTGRTPTTAEAVVKGIA